MRRSTICFFILAFVAAISGLAVSTYFNGRWKEWNDIYIQKKPILDVPSVVELPEQEANSICEARFTVANRGGGELVLDQFRTSCTCDGLEYQEGGEFYRVTDLRLAAGQSTVLRLRQSVRGQPGSPLQSPTRFRTNIPDTPEVLIVVSIPNVIGGLMTVPGTAHFGTVPIGASTKQIIHVYDRAAIPRAIRTIESTNPKKVHVKLLPPDPKAPDRKTEYNQIAIAALEVEIDTTQPGSCDFDLLADVGDGSQPFRVTVTGRVVPLVESIPSHIKLTRQSDGKMVSKMNCLLRCNTSDSAIFSLVSAPLGIRVTINNAGKQSIVSTASIELDPKAFQSGSSPQSVVLNATIAGVKHRFEIPVSVAAE